jgi:hypothetical protein
MYHLKNLVNKGAIALWLGLCLNQLGTPALAAEQSEAQSQLDSSYQGSVDATSYPLVPPLSECRSKPQSITVYEYDKTPLGDRQPFLLIHGLRGEYYQGFRWNELIRHFQAHDQFSKKYKLYLARYDSLNSLSQTVPLMRNAINQLYQSAARRPLSVMALSIGGNLVYEAMLDANTDSEVKLLVALGTPFHGSPLFSPDWFKYSLYKNWQSPFTRMDHALAYRLYFARNPNLLKDFAWDNCDNAIPDAGRFTSLLPFGPRGELEADKAANKTLFAVAEKPFDRKKIVAYSGYLSSPYLLSKPGRIFARTIMAPYDFCTIELPSHMLREDPVLKMLDRQIAAIRTTTASAQLAGTNFVYGLNDGITPLVSALFLPAKACASQAYAREPNIGKIKDGLDVRAARVFRDIDHLAFIGGGKGARKIKRVFKDELHPELGAHGLFDWMIFDINQISDNTSQIAREADSERAQPQD